VFVPGDVCSLKVEFALLHAMQTQRASGGAVPPILDLGAGWGWVVNAKARPLYSQERVPALTI
jgi:hypothetical protein